MAKRNRPVVDPPAGATPTGQVAHVPGPGAVAGDEDPSSRPSSGGTRRGFDTRPGLVIAAFLLPSLIIYSIFVLWPIANSFYFSTLDWDGISPATQVGLDNYRALISDGVAWQALWHNTVLVLASLIFQLPLGLALALVLLAPIRGTHLLRTVYFLPLLMSTVAIGILWSFIYNPTFGAANRVLEAIGLGALQQAWLGDPTTALPALVVVICWQFIPFYMILYRAGLTSIPGEVNEAAALDGASGGQRFRHVTVPLLRGTTRSAVLLSVIGALKYFDLIWVMTGGGPGRSTEVLATYMYSEAFSRNNYGYGSALAVVLFMFAMLATVIVLYTTRDAEEA